MKKIQGLQAPMELHQVLHVFLPKAKEVVQVVVLATTNPSSKKKMTKRNYILPMILYINKLGI